MFPLGMVLFPGAFLPLQVFEPRYRELVVDCLSTDAPEFGVVLIERGYEVGGGDSRFDVGCVARIVEVGDLPRGRLALATVGDRRVRVERWLDDDPYPRAEVSDWPDPEPEADDTQRRDEVAAQLRRVLALAAEVGDPVPPVAAAEALDDVRLASYQLASLAPIGPLDQLALLASGSVRARYELLGSLLTDAADVLASRLAGG
jgi:Lon protease-like protein